MAHWVEELNFPHLEIPITIDRIDPILSNSTFTKQETLYLSNLDDMIGVRAFTPTVYFYQSEKGHNQPVFQVLKDALRMVLVPYYPFTGRLRETKNGKLEVFFGPDQGALLVEAHSHLALADLGDLTVPNPAWINLLYRFPNEQEYKVVNMPLVIAQVTKFSCGGFSLGLRMCHCLCDGLGAMQFLNAWAQTAKTGFLTLNPSPCWDREIFLPRFPPKARFPHNEFKKMADCSTLAECLFRPSPRKQVQLNWTEGVIENSFAKTRENNKLKRGKLVQKCYRISREYQARLKTLSRAECTAFDAMAAHIWTSWVKALDVKPVDVDSKLRLTFSVNARGLLKSPPLKEGFYGNALCVACATSSVERLAMGSLGEMARLVHQARLGVSEEYLRSTIDYIEMCRPKRLEFDGKLTITQWTRFCIYESADFGWGKPVYAGPIDLTPTPQVCVFLPEGGVAGAMLLCICLPEYASHRFTQFLTDVIHLG